MNNKFSNPVETKRQAQISNRYMSKHGYTDRTCNKLYVDQLPATNKLETIFNSCCRIHGESHMHIHRHTPIQCTQRKIQENYLVNMSAQL